MICICGAGVTRVRVLSDRQNLLFIVGKWSSFCTVPLYDPTSILCNLFGKVTVSTCCKQNSMQTSLVMPSPLIIDPSVIALLRLSLKHPISSSLLSKTETIPPCFTQCLTCDCLQSNCIYPKITTCHICGPSSECDTT